MSAVLKTPMKLVPPTISAIGRAISEKLIAAPPMATSSTMAETKNCTSEEDESTDNALSSRLTICSYSCMCRSMPAERVSRLSAFLSTSVSSCCTSRQRGIMARSSSCRSALASR